MNWFADLEKEGRGMWFAVCSLDNKTFYGAGGLNDLSKEHKKAELSESLNRSQLTTDDWKRTISVSSVGISPRIKKLANEEKERLVNSGVEAVVEFFE